MSLIWICFFLPGWKHWDSSQAKYYWPTEIKWSNIASLPNIEGVSGRYFGDCKDEELLPKVIDVSVARELWDNSKVMVGNLKKE